MKKLKTDNQKFKELPSIWKELESFQEQMLSKTQLKEQKTIDFSSLFGHTSVSHEQSHTVIKRPQSPVRKPPAPQELTSSEIIHLLGGKKPKLMAKLGEIVHKNRMHAANSAMSVYIETDLSRKAAAKLKGSTPNKIQSAKKPELSLRLNELTEKRSHKQDYPDDTTLRHYDTHELNTATTRLTNRSEALTLHNFDSKMTETEISPDKVSKPKAGFLKLESPADFNKTVSQLPVSETFDPKKLLHLSPERELHEKIIFHASKYNNSSVSSHEQQLYKLQRWRGGNMLTDAEAADLERKILVRHKVRLYQLRLVRENCELIRE